MSNIVNYQVFLPVHFFNNKQWIEQCIIKGCLRKLKIYTLTNSPSCTNKSSSINLAASNALKYIAWKLHCVKYRNTEIEIIHSKHCRNCVFPENLHNRKLRYFMQCYMKTTKQNVRRQPVNTNGNVSTLLHMRQEYKTS